MAFVGLSVEPAFPGIGCFTRYCPPLSNPVEGIVNLADFWACFDSLPEGCIVSTKYPEITYNPLQGTCGNNGHCIYSLADWKGILPAVKGEAYFTGGKAELDLHITYNTSETLVSWRLGDLDPSTPSEECLVENTSPVFLAQPVVNAQEFSKVIFDLPPLLEAESAALIVSVHHKGVNFPPDGCLSGRSRVIVSDSSNVRLHLLTRGIPFSSGQLARFSTHCLLLIILNFVLYI